MGKGDKKSKRGKIIMGSTGVSRQKKKKTFIPVPKAVKTVEEKPVPEAAVVEAAIEKPAKKKAAAVEVTDEKPAKKKTTAKAKAAPKKAEKPAEIKPDEEKAEAAE